MSSQPQRVQLSRKKGWRMPENTVSVARPGRRGNPFYLGGYHKIGAGGGMGMARVTALDPRYADATFTHVTTNEQAVEMFRTYCERYGAPGGPVHDLRGKNLACWCALDEPCHADVLLKLANAEPSA